MDLGLTGKKAIVTGLDEGHRSGDRRDAARRGSVGRDLRP